MRLKGYWNEKHTNWLQWKEIFSLVDVKQSHVSTTFSVTVVKVFVISHENQAPFSFLMFLSLLEVGWTSLQLHDVTVLWTNQNPVYKHLNVKVATFVKGFGYFKWNVKKPESWLIIFFFFQNFIEMEILNIGDWCFKPSH